MSKEKGSAGKKAHDVAESTFKTLRSTVRTVHQRHRRLIGKGLLQGPPDVQEKMAKSLRALQLEVAAYQAEQQQLKNELAQLRTTVARQKVYTIDLLLAQFITIFTFTTRNYLLPKEYIQSLERSVEDPEPAVDFGSKNEEYTFLAFRFAAKCLVAGSTCGELARLVEVF